MGGFLVGGWGKLYPFFGDFLIFKFPNPLQSSTVGI